MGLILLIFISFSEPLLLKIMEKELNRSFSGLRKIEKELYFMQYEIIEKEEVYLSASYGAITSSSYGKNRFLTIDVRIGSPKLDNTHQLRGKYGFGDDFFTRQIIEVPIEDDEFAIRAILWKVTDEEFKKASERLLNVKMEKTTKVAEEDTSPDFHFAKKEIYIEKIEKLTLDTIKWKENIKELSKIFKEKEWIYSSRISISGEVRTKYLVNTEGTKIVESKKKYNLMIYAETKAEDGMRLYLTRRFYSHEEENLPSLEKIKNSIDSLINNLYALKNAPLIEPYSGPAILKNIAAGVFFHEILGHRIEGHRQKLEREGQTFKDKVGEKILPEFISIYDDPTIKNYKGKDLNGHYLYDDEGIKAQKVIVVENGILKNFLMSRSPIQGFKFSNGHGRREYGYKVVARQGNLIIESNKEYSYEELKKMLIEECKKQNKPYGLIFEDIVGGFTYTGRGFLQAFNVTPLLVKRIYLDGKEEVVRGVNIVGTPLVSFSKILATGNDYDVFNGTCGAESGMVPVSCVSPSILTAEIEVEKKEKEQEKLPILEPPIKEKEER